jgi:hypothetical protein
LKILVVGDWHSELHEEAVYHALGSLGHEESRFSWHQYFQPVGRGLTHNLSEIAGRIQNRLIAGPLIARLNADFLQTAFRIHPDAIFIYRGTHITRDSLQKIKDALPNTVFVGYNNDDPFSKAHPHSLWKVFFGAVPVYDLILAYRHHNIDDFKKAGAKRVELLRSWFIPERNRPVILTQEEFTTYGSDVVFVGHYEDDGRVEYLEAVVAAGFKLRLFGPGYDWDPILKKSRILRFLSPVRLVWGDQYNKALCGAKIALNFLSKLNRDTYTRRCFEIPATRTLMMSEYTEDLANLYLEDREAVFFKSKDELIAKLEIYLADKGLRKSVAEAGYRRVLKDKHDVVSRMEQVIGFIEDIQKGKTV